MTRTQLGNAFGPGREVDVCDVCGVVVLVPRAGEPDWPGIHAHTAPCGDTWGSMTCTLPEGHGAMHIDERVMHSPSDVAARTPADP
jgi:hypothetical protein